MDGKVYMMVQFRELFLLKRAAVPSEPLSLLALNACVTRYYRKFQSGSEKGELSLDLQTENLCNCYTDESSVGTQCYLASTLNTTMFAYSPPYLLLPEAWLKNDEGMDQLNYSARGVHCVAANINIRPAGMNIKTILSLYPEVLRLSIYFG